MTPSNASFDRGPALSRTARALLLSVIGIILSLVAAMWAESIAHAAETSAPSESMAESSDVATEAVASAAPAEPSPAATPSESPAVSAEPVASPSEPASSKLATEPEKPPVETEEEARKRRDEEEENREEAEERREDEEERLEDEARRARGPGALIGDGSRKIAIGGYGGITALGSWVDHRAALLLGAEGGVLLDHRLAIGLAGFALATETGGPTFSNGNDSVLGFGYGGLSMRYQFVGKGPIYASAGVLVGGGIITLLERSNDDTFDFDEEPRSANGFLVVEPSVQLHANLTHWMRLGLNASYRLVHGVSSYGYEEKDFRAPAFGGHLQFGWF